MKITIVQGAFFPVPPLIGGAVEKVWFALGKEFVRRGHQVIHISRAYKGFLPTEEVIDGVKHVRVKGFDAPANLLLLKFLDLIYSWRVKKVLPEADILITNTFWLPMLIRSLRFGRLYVHIQRYPKGQMRAYRNAARLQTVSNAIARAIIEQEPWSKDRVCVIPNFVEAFKSETAERRKVVLYVGRIHPEKGIGLLIDAFNLLIQGGLKEWRLVLVGPWQTNLGGGGEAYKNKLQRKFEDIRQHIDWTGPVFSEEKLAEFYRRASLFIYPSLAEKGEAFPMAPLEAMSYGCPVVVSDLECFRDFISDGNTGLVFNHRSPKPAIALSAKLETLIESKELLCKIGKNGYNKSLEFSLDRIATMYLSDFESLAGKQSLP
jgi:glycosyltransferase involved in cell wall biosynthesis